MSKYSASGCGIGIITLTWIILLALSANPDNGCAVASNVIRPVASTSCDTLQKPSFLAPQIVCRDLINDICDKDGGKRVRDMQIAGIFFVCLEGTLTCIVIILACIWGCWTFAEAYGIAKREQKAQQQQKLPKIPMSV